MSSEVPLAYRSRSPSSSVNGSAPAVIFLHGRGADETDLLPIAKQLPDYMHIFSVRGPIDFEDGYAWYNLSVDQGGLHNSQPDTDSFRTSSYRLAKFIDYISSKYPIDSSKIGLFGFSQGGTLAIGTAIEAPDRVNWVVALNSYLPDVHQSVSKLANARSVSMFLAAGELDVVIPEERTERASNRLRDVGVDVTYKTYTVGHGATDAEIQDTVRWIQQQV
ncbi:dienelactone hydrolase family protein [Salinarchaeum sp. IM2453]|uniref:alpha/beta hydrolase n=1 Tax=Salinarchaeum sp. IM2453 TaxID=2862870 RepID=UPI001C8332F1|nr:alpha/beta fold hydrolase [Salinarchaeum sp. IM2453]QZA88796.1 dienelactone hydrolase family protein [Salinarchaeum sp. IM2453]